MIPVLGIPMLGLRLNGTVLIIFFSQEIMDYFYFLQKWTNNNLLQS